MLVVSSTMHVVAHYYNYERLARYSPPNTLPPGDQARSIPTQALPFNGSVGVSGSNCGFLLSGIICNCGYCIIKGLDSQAQYVFF